MVEKREEKEMKKAEKREERGKEERTVIAKRDSIEEKANR